MTFYHSTRTKQKLVDADTAIIKGLADLQGLYVPEEIPQLDYRLLLTADYLSLASAILQCYFNNEHLTQDVQKAYQTNFDCSEVTPLVKVGNDYFLELYHGPTCAFKDVALTLLPHLLTSAYQRKAIQKNIVILTATSGDTGKAALEGFKDVEKVFIKVLYPDQLVSSTQQRQMVTTEGANTEVLAVKGNFDDCQRAVKELMEKNLIFENLQLSSANSINIGRLIPQIVYYFKAYIDLIQQHQICPDESVDFIVPTGNFGNILAGYLAKRMGLPIGKLICASNENHVLTDFLQTGCYDRNRALIKTSSPSIDILVSSNLERLLYFESQDDQKVKAYMEQLNNQGFYQIDDVLLKQIQNHFIGYYANQQEVAQIIQTYYQQYHYLMDTHTAVAVCCMQKYQQEYPAHPCVVLATASPFKFSKDVYQAITGKEITDDLNCPDILADWTGKPLPEAIAHLKDKPIRFRQVISKEDIQLTLIKKLQEINHD